MIVGGDGDRDLSLWGFGKWDVPTLPIVLCTTPANALHTYPPVRRHIHNIFHLHCTSLFVAGFPLTKSFVLIRFPSTFLFIKSFPFLKRYDLVIKKLDST